MKVLVTGATGFTGAHLARHLLAAGDDVRVLVRDAARLPEDLVARVEVVEGDITDGDDRRTAVAGV